MRKKIIGWLTLAVLLVLGAFSPAMLPEQQAAAQGGGVTNQSTQPAVAPSANPALDTFVASTPASRVLLNEMTLVWLHDEDYARIIASCAGTGLRNVAPFPNGSMVLIPTPVI
jgi:hypothetical protein